MNDVLPTWQSRFAVSSFQFDVTQCRCFDHRTRCRWHGGRQLRRKLLRQYRSRQQDAKADAEVDARHGQIIPIPPDTEFRSRPVTFRNRYGSNSVVVINAPPRSSVRALVRDKGFSITVLMTLAICVMANTTTFAIVNCVLLRPLPLPEADDIVLSRTGTRKRSQRLQTRVATAITLIG